MALRDINIFEKHVEKIVLGAASAGTLFMFYLAAQPVTVEPPTGVREPVTPSSVETVIHDALGEPVAPPSTPDDIKRLEAKPDKTVEESMALIKSYGPPKVRLPDYTALYEDLASGKPLDAALVDTRVPTIGAPNFSPQHIAIETSSQNYALKTPDAPEPEYVHAESTQFLVLDRTKIPNPDNIVLPLPPGTILPTTEKKVVVIDGWIPVGQMLKQMLQERDLKARIPDAARQRVIVQDIKVTREEILPSGAATDPVAISPPKGATPVEPIAWGALAAADLPSAMDALDAQFKQIVLPDFDRDAQGVPIPPPILTQPVPDKVDSETASLRADIAAAQAGGIVGPVIRPGVPVTPGAAPAAAPAVMLPADITQVKQLEVIPFTFWDETVNPGHTYRYHVTVDFVNPVFGWADGLKNEADKSKPALAAAPITIDKVHVNSDVEFFVSDNINNRENRDVTVRVFKHTNGRWYYRDFGVPVGAKIAGMIPTPDAGPNQGVDVDTGFTLVDKQTLHSGSGIGSAGLHVVLQDVQGNLVTRDSIADRNNQQQSLLLKDAAKSTTTAPATEPAANTPPPGVYIPPTPPRGTPPSPASTRPIPPTPPRGNVPVTPRRGT